MRSVFLFFVLMVALACLWIAMPAEARQVVIRNARKFLPAVLIAAALTIAMLAFAFLTTGKVI